MFAKRYRHNRIGAYVVSTVQHPDDIARCHGAEVLYETMTFSDADEEWDADESAVQTTSKSAADAAHDAACDKARLRTN